MYEPKVYEARHCGAHGCKCSHSNSCNAGWLEPEGPVTFDQQPKAIPCGMCFPSLRLAYDKAQSPAEFSYLARKRDAKITVEQEYWQLDGER